MNKIYGTKVYIEDGINNLIDKVNELYNNPYEYEYKNNHYFYNNTYISTQEDIGNTILNIINNYNYVNKRIRYIISKENAILYNSSYFDTVI